LILAVDEKKWPRSSAQAFPSASFERRRFLSLSSQLPPHQTLLVSVLFSSVTKQVDSLVVKERMDYRQLKLAAASSSSSAVQEAAKMVKDKELKLRAERDKVSLLGGK